MQSSASQSYLGKLCSRGHDYESTGKSLRYRSNHTCFRCINEHSKAYKASHPERPALSAKRWRQRVAAKKKNPPAQKRCSRCKAVKSCDSFYPEKYSADGLRSSCKACDSETQSIRLAQNKKPRTVLPDSVKANNKRAAKQRYKRTPKGKATSARHAHKRRIAKTQGEYIPYSALQLAQRFSYFNNECAYCGSIEGLTIDHLVPLSKRGADKIENIVPACLICNSGKGNKEALTWYQSKSFYSAERWEHINNSNSDAALMALRRAAAKFGLGLGLYEKKPEQRG